jgi:o-succinylbenzoate synthase
VRLRRAALHPFTLPLKRPLATAHGPISARQGWLVELEDEAGRRGLGEATPLADFGTEDLQSSRRSLEAGLSRWLRQGEIGDEPIHASEGAPCARFALDAARYDLAAKVAGRSLAEELCREAGRSDPPETLVGVQALFAGSTPQQVEENARLWMSRGFAAFKLKLAVSPTERDGSMDLERVSALRSTVGVEARIRLDANEAWERDEAAEVLAALAGFEIDYVEQPVRRDDLVGLEWLSREAAIPVAADEALLGKGLAACLDARAASILIVKPAAIGGLSDSIALWQRAQREGLRVIWSTLIEGAVGRSAALALAAALGPVAEIHGLGTADLLAADLASSSVANRLDADGRMEVLEAAGIGFDPVIPSAASAPKGQVDRGLDSEGAQHAQGRVLEIRN